MLRIATRGSPLAIWQAEHIASLLRAAHPGIAIGLVPLVSSGDLLKDRPLRQAGGIGLFTKEIQAAVLDGRADVAVHSLKDLPTTAAPGLILGAVPPRGPVRDVLITPNGFRLDELPAGSSVGTGSPRRRALLARHRSDLRLVDIRGNVETRIRKTQEGEYDAIVLAAAGVVRLGLEAAITEELDLERFPPAPGQGALGIECRADDYVTQELLAPLEDPATRQCVEAERAFLQALQGGCQIPIGAHARQVGDRLVLHGILLEPDGETWFEGTHEGPASDPRVVGGDLASRLLQHQAKAGIG